jgi:hypothetical protein
MMMYVIVRVTVLVVVIVVMVVMPVSVCGCRLLKPELGRRHTGPEHTLGRDGFRVQRETSQSAAQLRQRQPDVEQRAEHHVPGRSGETIEVRGFRHVRAFPSREN